jgi:hypothetical protein
MDEALQLFTSVSMLAVALGAWLGTAVLRALVEYLYPPVAEAKWYRDVALPLVPLVIGAALALAMPDLHTVALARAILGAFAGLHSGYLYGRVKALLK